MDNKKYWMKRRRYGWGWTPTTWQGIAFILLQIGVLLVAALQLPLKPAQPSAGQIINFLLIALFVVASLIIVSLQIAPKPRWRWGKKPSDNPNEDF